MAREIERKFLVRSSAYRQEAFAMSHIIQGYLSSVPERVVRIRLRDSSGFITVKGSGSGSGVSRFEWEKEIEASEAESLLTLAEPGVIDKLRYLVRNTDGTHVWEVDEFHGDNEGLVMAEIELSDEEETFERPSWLGEEVTGDHRYYNSMLMKVPYSSWKIEISAK